MKALALIASFFLLGQSASAFAPAPFSRSSVVNTAMAASTAMQANKGFGSEAEKPKKQVSQGQAKREGERSRYDEIAGTGGQEYNIFVRQFGSDDSSWLPCGAVAVPRAAQVSDAVYANIASLKTAITRTYPKLKGSEDEFEFGFNLKIYPDDPIEVATKSTKVPGLSVGNWISNLLSPVDASKVPPPPTNEQSS